MSSMSCEAGPHRLARVATHITHKTHKLIKLEEVMWVKKYILWASGLR